MNISELTVNIFLFFALSNFFVIFEDMNMLIQNYNIATFNGILDIIYI